MRPGFPAPGLEPIRADFPILTEIVHGKPLVYLDSANTSQKPTAVLQAMDHYYRHANANIHRATHLLSERATAAYEGTRAKAARFINAPDARSIVLTTGTTDGINLVAHTYGRMVLKPGERRCPAEHHSNIVPWQIPAERRARSCGRADRRSRRHPDRRLRAPLSDLTNITGHVPNALGTINPIER
jgi:cysteine desulfurase/selenocysteine lyase